MTFQPAPNRQGKAMWDLVRPLTSALSGALSLSAWCSVRPEADFWSFPAMFGLGLCLCMFGFAVNDILDIHKDRAANRTDKPLATGALSVEAALLLSVLLFSVTLVFAWAFGQKAFVASSIGLFALIIYSPAARLLPVLKGLFTGLLTCLPLVIAYRTSDATMPAQMLAAITVFIVGREVFIDLGDHQFDAKLGLMTIPGLIGENRAVLMGSVFMLSGTILAYLSQTALAGKFLVALAGLILLGLVLFHRSIGTNSIVRWSRIPMLLSIAALVFA